MVDLAEGMLKKALGTTSDGSLPPYISVHIRRNDFTGWCSAPRNECLAPLSAYVRRVAQVRSKILSNHPEWTEDDIKVIVMSDELRITPPKDSEPAPNTHGYIFEEGECERWWKSTEDLGWKSYDHIAEKTEEQYGIWYPSLLDAVMLSLAQGFVGTDRSTYSLMAKRRVEEWNDDGGGWGQGLGAMVKWGWVGADDD